LIRPILEKTDSINPNDLIKSVTFISGDIYSNKKLLESNPEYLANLLSQDDETKAQLLDGNWKVKIDENDLYHYHTFSDVFTNSQVKQGNKRITADIALKGSDKFIVIVWSGFVVIDISVIGKSDGKEVIDEINRLKELHKVSNSSITFDNDGAGSFIDGFIKGSIEFNNGSTAINKENYFNLKTQCYYKSSDRVNNGGVYIPEEIASRMYDDKMTIKQRLMFERKAIKRFKKDADGKLRINAKDDMKRKIKGQSRDLFDALMMVEVFELKPKRKAPRSSAPIKRRR
jgi:hypothetical protein